MKVHFALLLGALALPTVGLAANTPKHNYPTQARVEYVFGCMQQLGGESYDTLYKCSCSIDYIADHLSYDDYITLDTYTRGEHAGGERPEVLREGKLARGSRAEFAKLKSEAADQCLIHDDMTGNASKDAD